jgi:hypothetical protein
MATFLDLSILSGLSSVFAFLLVFALMYGLLTYTKIFNLSNGLASIISLSIAFMILFSRPAMLAIQLVTPWYVIMFFIIIMIVMMSLIFVGPMGDKSLGTMMGPENLKIVINWILIIALIILMTGLSSIFLSGEDSPYAINTDGSTVQTNTSSNVGGIGSAAAIDIIFHPKVLGVIAFMVIATFTVFLMGSKG